MPDNSRDKILAALGQTEIEATDLPSLDQDWQRFDDPMEQFVTVLQSVGGQAIRVAGWEQINEELAKLPSFQNANKIASTDGEIHRANVNLADIADPHGLADIDFFVGRGEFAVAENGAVWVTDRDVPHRALFFIIQHLAIVVSADQLVDNLHQAYQRLKFDSPGFGLFLSGPSKTADIEQSLVIGAHGARSLTVFLLGGD